MQQMVHAGVRKSLLRLMVGSITLVPQARGKLVMGARRCQARMEAFRKGGSRSASPR